MAESTGVSPHFLVHGQAYRAPIDHLDGMHVAQQAQLTATAWTTLYTRVRQRLLAAQDHQKRYADKRRRELTFEPGEKVLLSTRHLQLRVPTRKFADRFVGPFAVVKRVGPTAYRLDLA